MKNPLKKYLAAFGASFFLTALLIPIPAFFDHTVKLVAAGLLYAILTYTLLLKIDLNKLRIIVFISLPPLLLYIPLHIILDATERSMPSSAFHLIGIAFGALIYFAKLMAKRIAYIVILISLCIFMPIRGNEMYGNLLDYGQFTETIDLPAPQFVLENAEGKVFTNADFKDKILVIDFWTTSCGQCFKKFPVVETLTEKVKGRSDILIISVNNQLGDDTKEKAIEMIRNRGYTFDVLFSDIELTNKQFNFNLYPMVFIIQNGEKIIYRGTIDHVESVLDL